MPRTHSISWNLKHLNKALERALMRALADGDVPYSQAGVLSFLAGRAGEPTSQRQIEEYFGVSNPAVSGLVKRLHSKGFVAVGTDPADQRRRAVQITAAGLTAMETARRSIDAVDEQVLDGFTAAESAEFQRLIAKARHNLSAAAVSPLPASDSPASQRIEVNA
ncbi:MarR family winged helix-turn-helix transcriptional regulator [Actinomyces ruminis]|nr:MarR family transcriptional regulator [Actinomyces ruminis]